MEESFHQLYHQIVNPTPGWYRGDFHLHTTASDGKYTLQELLQLSKQAGCDFIAVTDHNSIQAFDQPYQENGLAIIPGIEVTLAEGHWNALGVPGWCRWMEHVCVGQIQTTLEVKPVTVNQLLDEIRQQGILNSINHPLLAPWEWRDGTTDWRHVHCVEVWNDPFWPDNRTATPQAIAMWTDLLNEGYRITAVGGSDFHFLPEDSTQYPGEIPGLPFTYVYGENLSWKAVIDGLLHQRVYISRGAQLNFQAQANGQSVTIGGDLGEGCEQVELFATISGFEGKGELRLIRNGLPVRGWLLDQPAGEFEWLDAAPEIFTWYRLDVLDAEGQFLALTNPIFSGVPVSPSRFKFADFV